MFNEELDPVSGRDPVSPFVLPWVDPSIAVATGFVSVVPLVGISSFVGVSSSMASSGERSFGDLLVFCMFGLLQLLIVSPASEGFEGNPESC